MPCSSRSSGEGRRCAVLACPACCVDEASQLTCLPVCVPLAGSIRYGGLNRFQVAAGMKLPEDDVLELLKGFATLDKLRRM